MRCSREGTIKKKTRAWRVRGWVIMQSKTVTRPPSKMARVSPLLMTATPLWPLLNILCTLVLDLLHTPHGIWRGARHMRYCRWSQRTHFHPTHCSLLTQNQRMRKIVILTYLFKTARSHRGSRVLASQWDMGAQRMLLCLWTHLQ